MGSGSMLTAAHHEASIMGEADRPDLIDYARRVAEAEIDLQRVRRAGQTLARLPTAAATSYRLVDSPNNLLTL
jgi:hypothetical protein